MEERIVLAFALLDELADELHEGKFGPARREYIDARAQGRMPGCAAAPTLQKRYVSWDGVLTAAGLPVAPRHYHTLRSMARRYGREGEIFGRSEAHMRRLLRVANAEKHLEAEYAERGLPVTSERDVWHYDVGRRRWVLSTHYEIA